MTDHQSSPERVSPYMRLLLIGIAAVLVVFAVLQLNDPDSLRWFFAYASGAVVAALAVKPWVCLLVALR